MNAVLISDPRLQAMTPVPGSRRILALAFPHLATDRIARMRWGVSWRSRGRPEASPIVCSERVGGALRLLSVDEHARSHGLRPGQGVTEARAICPSLDVVQADLVADQRFLDAIGDWADRYTPLVGMDRPDGLFLDISGCAHLFGGEKTLLDDCLNRLFYLGVDARAAIARI